MIVKFTERAVSADLSAVGPLAAPECVLVDRDCLHDTAQEHCGAFGKRTELRR